MESLALFGFQHYLYFQRCQIQIKLTNWDRYLLARIVNNNTVSRFADILIIKRNYSLLDVEEEGKETMSESQRSMLAGNPAPSGNL